MSVRDTDIPDPAPSAEADGGFLGRWSRRKQAVAKGETPPEPVPPSAAPVEAKDEPPLPDPLSLGMDDDFSGFLRDKVPATLKRQALQHLFSHAHFNQVDGLDVYMEDFNQVANLDAASMELVKHAKAVLDPTPRDAVPDEASASLEADEAEAASDPVADSEATTGSADPQDVASNPGPTDDRAG